MSTLDNSQTGGFGIRFAGRVIDWVAGMVIGVVGGVFGGIVCALLAAAGKVDNTWVQRVGQTNVFSNLGWGLLASLLYHVVCESVGGTSFGKLVLGYRVVMTNLTPCTLGAAIKRDLAYFVDSFFFGLPAHSAMSKSTLNQRIGDTWADTLVVRRGALPPGGVRSNGLVALGLFGGPVASGLISALSVIAKAF